MRVTLIVNRGYFDLDLEPSRTLADALSTECAVNGGHLGCTDGTCGACTVLVDGIATRGCLTLAVQCSGTRIVTVDGLADDHPLRAVLAKDKLVDGGHCLPGLVMLCVGAIEYDPELAAEPEQLGRLLASNVCRHPGHAAIQQAVIHAASQPSHSDRWRGVEFPPPVVHRGRNGNEASSGGGPGFEGPTRGKTRGMPTSRSDSTAQGPALEPLGDPDDETGDFADEHGQFVVEGGDEPSGGESESPDPYTGGLDREGPP